MNNSIPYIIGQSQVTAFIDGLPCNIPLGNFNDTVKEALATGDKATLLEASRLDYGFNTIGDGKVKVDLDKMEVTYEGEVLHDYASKKVLEFIEEELPYEHLIRFIERIMMNKRSGVVNNLYKFLSYGGFPITEEGKFLGYKAVRFDYKDIHSGTMDNSPGSFVQERENLVCDDPNIPCARGLHVGTLEYATNFGRDNFRIVICEVDPAEVVSVPNDYDCQKLRTWKYKVVDELYRNDSGSFSKLRDVCLFDDDCCY